MSQLIEEIVRSLHHESQERNIHLAKDIESNIIRLADASLLQVVVRNLVHNAIKFTPPGGEVTVTLTSRSFSVRDTGIGISPDVLERIFHRFFKADSSRSSEGFGLGLTILKRVVDLHHWQVSVRSTPKVGSTFTVWFDESTYDTPHDQRQQKTNALTI